VGHGDGAARGFVSKVTSVRPAAEGLTVHVLAGDDELHVRNDTGRELVVEGYEGEPYLRFEADGGVYRNVNSPATYLNEERYGGVDVPATASKGAEPEWERVSRGRAYEWHDHRIHWMSPIDPPQVRAAPDAPHHVFDWRVPALLEGRKLTFAGTLDYVPPPGQAFPVIMGVPILLLVAAGAVAFWLRRRRRSVEG
jgi:hypothetical protein